MLNPVFIVSLDFELHWGRFDKYKLEDYQEYYRNTREVVVPRLLNLFEKYGIHATWATVGMLMADDFEEWEHYAPELKPQYDFKKLSPYHWKSLQKTQKWDGLFAPELVNHVIDIPGQELASHTFAHYYSCEKGQERAAFKEDLLAAKRIAKEKYGQELKSLVFPRNQYDRESLLIAQEAGFDAYRSNPEDWFWKRTENETILKKVFRTGDTLIPLSDKYLFEIEKAQDQQILPIPASRLLRPYKNVKTLHQIRIEKIKREMTEAASQKKAYHLWWHPHNFGFFPLENLRYLESLLQHFAKLKDTADMQSLTMSQCVEKSKQLTP